MRNRDITNNEQLKKKKNTRPIGLAKIKNSI